MKNELITEFMLVDEDEYSMNGKTLRCIIELLPDDAKIPFAEIKQIDAGRKIIYDQAILEINREIARRKQLMKSKLCYEDGKFIIDKELLKP